MSLSSARHHCSSRTQQFCNQICPIDTSSFSRTGTAHAYVLEHMICAHRHGVCQLAPPSSAIIQYRSAAYRRTALQLLAPKQLLLSAHPPPLALPLPWLVAAAATAACACYCCCLSSFVSPSFAWLLLSPQLVHNAKPRALLLICNLT